MRYPLSLYECPMASSIGCVALVPSLRRKIHFCGYGKFLYFLANFCGCLSLFFFAHNVCYVYEGPNAKVLLSSELVVYTDDDFEDEDDELLDNELESCSSSGDPFLLR
jgi:hypothetical protein